jgi:hypothetical protein
MADMPTQLPPEVANALAKGNLIEAMKLLRAQYKDIGLAEARRLLEALQKQGQVKANATTRAKRAVAAPRSGFGPKLSPGEVPRGGGGGGAALALIVAAAIAAGLYARYF